MRHFLDGGWAWGGVWIFGSTFMLKDGNTDCTYALFRLHISPHIKKRKLIHTTMAHLTAREESKERGTYSLS